MMPYTMQQPGQYLGETANVGGNLDTFLVQQMHALAISISQAKVRNDKATVQALLDRFKALADEYRARGDVDLSGTDNFILRVGQWIDDSVTAIPDAVSALPRAISAGVFRAVLPFALMYVGLVLLKRFR
jgi:hypothetical protein